jgi:hypothetical protein
MNSGWDKQPVQPLLGHSTVTVAMRYTHTNLESKRAEVAKLSGARDSLETVAPKCSNGNALLSQDAQPVPVIHSHVNGNAVAAVC